MARKPRPEPITQGCLADIYRHFFGVLVPFKPDNMDLGEFMEQLFDYKNRDIVRYECHTRFQMPGLYCVAPHVKIQGIGYRLVTPGTALWVRTDARQPDRVDVEWQGGVGNKDHVFCLSASEWGWVRLNLKEVERERKK